MEKPREPYQKRERQWDDAWPEAPEGHNAARDSAEVDTEDELMPFPEVVGTDDPIVAVTDAEPYMPPTDPPVLPGGAEGVHVATGFGISPDEEAADSPPPRGDEDIRQQAVLALQQDSLTSQLGLLVQVHDGVIRLAGAVPSIDDADYAMNLLGNLAGVIDVDDETTVEMMNG